MSFTIQPVLMSGGSGLRLWPLSRQRRPKQFASLTGDLSLFQQTALRTRTGEGLEFLQPQVIASAAHADLIHAQLSALNIDPARTVLEPVGRDTAAAAAAAALIADAPDRLVLLLPCDHVVLDPDSFHAALRIGAKAAAAGRIVTLGAAPQGPDTAYGYIKRGAAEGEAFAVEAFHEKPDRARAEAYLAEGGYSWNAGIFLFRADVLIGEFERFAGDILDCVRRALEGATERTTVLPPEVFGACRAQAFDRAVMEKTAKAVVVPVDMGWSDAGQWSAIWELAAKDAAGNALAAAATAVDSTGCLVRSDGPAVMLAGVKDIVVVVQDGAVLVTHKDAAGSVKTLVEALKASSRHDLL